MNFENQTVFITGAASGIGKKTAREFLDRNAKVVAIDMNKEGLQTFVGENKDKVERILAIVTDVSKSDEVNKSVAETIKWSGRIDVLVNSAGIYKPVMLVDTTDEFWDTIHKINLYGTFYCCRSVAREMIKRKYGRIINLASSGGQRGSIGNSNYSSTKRGVEGFSRSVALELASYNITVNCVSPGPTLTPILSEEVLKERGEAWLKSIPLGRFGAPEDIAKAILFLASGYSDYITGITLDVNGGIFMH